MSFALDPYNDDELHDKQPVVKAIVFKGGPFDGQHDGRLVLLNTDEIPLDYRLFACYKRSGKVHKGAIVYRFDGYTDLWGRKFRMEAEEWWWTATKIAFWFGVIMTAIIYMIFTNHP
jgi:hypothetical protein